MQNIISTEVLIFMLLVIVLIVVHTIYIQMKMIENKNNIIKNKNEELMHLKKRFDELLEYAINVNILDAVKEFKTSNEKVDNDNTNKIEKDEL